MNVTLFGESAGGLSGLSQLSSRGARGLFGRAIMESGSYALNEAPLATAEASGAAFARKVGCRCRPSSRRFQLPRCGPAIYGAAPWTQRS